MSNYNSSSEKGNYASRLRHKERESHAVDDSNSEDESISKRRTRNSTVKSIDSSSEDSEPVRETSRRTRKRPRSKPPVIQAKLSGGAQKFVKDGPESARDRFLEENSLSDDSSGWIVEDDEVEEDDSESDSDEMLVEDSDGSESEVAGGTEVKTAAGGDEASSDEDTVSPAKKSKSQRIHSDDSEASDTPPADGQESDNQSECKKKRKKKRRRVILPPDSQDMNEQVDNSDNNDSIVTLTSTDDMSDFVVDDDESVTAEDGSIPLMYPEEEYLTSTSKMMDRKQAFTVVMESMVLHALDPIYFKTEEFKKNKDIGSAFSKVFAPLDVLLNDIKSQAWRKSFSDALQHREMNSVRHHSYASNSCEACCKGDRYASYKVQMSGERYDRNSLEPIESDAADSNDDEDSATPLTNKTFLVGKYCLKRAEKYHDVLHFKLSLLETCRAKVNRDEYRKKSADDIIDDLIVKNSGWIDPQYTIYSSLVEKTRELIRRRSGMLKVDDSFG